MRFNLASLFCAVALLSGSFALTGCASGSAAAPAPVVGVSFQGKVSSGSQAITGAAVYLYAAGTSGYGGASTSLLTNSVLTDAAGNSGVDSNGNYYITTNSTGAFSVPADFTCTAGQQVYLYVLGGNSGVGVNSAIGELAVLGNCPSLSTPLVNVNEVTTIAAAYAFAGYATTATHVSSSGTALASTGVANAFANAGNLANISTGAALALTPAGNAVVPQATINTLANSLAACINSAGPGFSSCNTLFIRTTSLAGIEPTDTATSAINIAHLPWSNLSSLYSLSITGAVYSPALTAVPNDLTIALKFTGGGLNIPYSVAIDGSGDAWIANNSGSSVTEISGTGVFLSGNTGYKSTGIANSEFIAIDTTGSVWTSNTFTNSVSKLSSSGVPLTGSPFTTASLTYPQALAVDPSNNVWVASYLGSDVTEISSTGSILSPAATGYTASGVVKPNSVAIDTAGNAWVGNTSTLKISEISSTGAALSGAAGYSIGDYPYDVAFDAAGNVWIAGAHSVVELSSAGVLLSGSGYGGGGIATPDAIAIDGLGYAWIANGAANSVSEFTNAGVAITQANGYNSGGIAAPTGIAVDGSGNVWTANSGTSNSVTEIIGLAAPVVTPIATAVKNKTLGMRP